MNEFDRLNTISFRDFFGEMELTKKQKNDRIRLAEELEDAILIYLMLIQTMLKNEAPDFTFARETLQEELSKVVPKYTDDDFAAVYVTLVAALLSQTTEEHISEPYFLSYERAHLAAANEALDILNNKDYEDAVDNGFHFKTWVTEKDERVREAHAEVDEIKIPINEYFIVGDELMRFPHDYNASPKNTANCRCTIVYTR